MLIDNDDMLLNNVEVAKKFSQYFEYITDSLIYMNFLM